MKVEASPSVKLIFDQKAPLARSSSCSSSSSDSSTSSSRGSHSSGRSRRSSRGRRRSPSSSSSSSRSRSRSRSRSHPRCHRVSSHSRCRHCHYSPPRRYRAHSRSYSPSPERSSGRRRYRQRSRSSSRSRSPSPYGYSRRSSRSPVHRRGGRFVGRNRCRFSPSPYRYRSHRSRSRSQERTAIRLSQAEKKYLLDVAKTNAARILGVQNLELPASLKELEEQEEKRSSSVQEKRFRDDSKPAQVNHDDDSGEGTSHASPKTKPLTFNINNTVAKPSNSPMLNDSKVTSRADSVGDRKPYGRWIPIGKSSKGKH
ncbi:arginine/serine-rich protein 1 [Triplophysa dalaica]|uniref:arginine/serine-rich protein 1 n=1 Tax=Triplophysa dalaica TaxID=1582913 RepID=UPI0024DFF125|nr:arginine/serine-rich protein 1 [Triplophysa dalaica]